jgi:hypothetical protein
MDLESILWTIGGCVAGGVIGVNLRQFVEARAWVRKHGLDPMAWYEPMVQGEQRGLKWALRYYVGAPGRVIGYHASDCRPVSPVVQNTEKLRYRK